MIPSFADTLRGLPAAVWSSETLRILKTAAPEKPIYLSTETTNTKAQNLYRSVGFPQTDWLDGDDPVFYLIDATFKMRKGETF